MAFSVQCPLCQKDYVVFSLAEASCPCGGIPVRTKTHMIVSVRERIDTGFQARAVDTFADAVDRYSIKERDPKVPVR